MGVLQWILSAQASGVLIAFSCLANARQHMKELGRQLRKETTLSSVSRLSQFRSGYLAALTSHASAVRDFVSSAGSSSPL